MGKHRMDGSNDKAWGGPELTSHPHSDAAEQSAEAGTPTPNRDTETMGENRSGRDEPGA